MKLNDLFKTIFNGLILVDSYNNKIQSFRCEKV